MSEWVETHLPCPSCTSSDGYSINDKGWGKCFVCNVNIKEFSEGEEPVKSRGKQVAKDKSLLPLGEYRALTHRYMPHGQRVRLGRKAENYSSYSRNYALQKYRP